MSVHSSLNAKHGTYNGKKLCRKKVIQKRSYRKKIIQKNIQETGKKRKCLNGIFFFGNLYYNTKEWAVNALICGFKKYYGIRTVCLRYAFRAGRSADCGMCLAAKRSVISFKLTLYYKRIRAED